MTQIKLDEIKKEELVDLLNKQVDLTISIDKKFDASLLETINNSANSEKKITLNIFLNENLPVELWVRISNIKRLLIHPSYKVQLENIDILKGFNILESLELTGDYTKKNQSFKPIEHIESLIQFTFVKGLTNQYKFLNQQEKLEKLYVGNIDLGLVIKKEQLHTLRVDNTLKSENLMSEKFPNLKNLHLHGCSRLTHHTFLTGLTKIECLNVSYNSHITEFPKMANPELIKTIEMFT
ncbi:MAG: hypothetical protein ABUL44_00255, partial [Flavobacterium sp.]